MGECGCKNFHPDYGLPGPDGSVYALQIDPGCPYCDEHRVGVVVQKLSGEAVEDWDAKHLPKFPIRPIGGRNFQEGVLLVVNPDHVADDLIKYLVEGLDYEDFNVNKDLAEEFRDEVRRAVREGIFKSRKDASEDEYIA
jgi:hypothetical protein